MHKQLNHSAGQRQRGQASVFMLALLGVVLICAILLYQSGKLTSEKMQLQNAADAAAFGASNLEARALNFAAYTNRAMVGNEVGVAQMVGMLSWADELQSGRKYCQFYSDLFYGISAACAAFGVLAPLVPLFAGIGDAFQTLGQVMGNSGDFLVNDFLKPIGPYWIGFLGMVNQVYSVSQEVYFWGSEYLAAANIYQSLADNVPQTEPGNILTDLRDIFLVPEKDKQGAQLSSFGALALAGHFSSLAKGDLSQRFAPQAKKENQGMGRMAATVREARDPFSSGGPAITAKNVWGQEITYGNRDWTFGLDMSLNWKILKLHLFFGGDSKGGSEIRYKEEDKKFVWSAADTLVMEGEVDYHALWGLVKGKKKLDAPLGAGVYQATAKKKGGTTALDAGDMDFAIGTEGDPKAYGGAAEDGGRWPPWVTGVQPETAANKIDSWYSGLQPYRDVPPAEKKDGSFTWPWQAPCFLVGVTRSMNDITSRGPQFADELDLVRIDDKQTMDRLAAIAKAEVYFSRPTTPDYFARLDKKQEKPNVFSPFWQPRLVNTSDTDRLLALAFQSHTIWLSANDARAVPGLDKVVQVLENFLQIVDDLAGFIKNLLKLQP